jgi:hypothetical protein
MITIQNIKDGYCVSVPLLRWTYWVYPEDNEIRNNGERYREVGKQVSPRLTLPMGWTLGDVVDEVSKNAKNPNDTMFGFYGYK